MLRRERAFDRVSRSFALEHELGEASASARCRDGGLEQARPKQAAAAARRPAVQSARRACTYGTARRLYLLA